MNIPPISTGSPVTRLHGSTAQRNSQGPKELGAAGEDTVQISDLARYLGEIKKLPDIRQNKVENVRTALANGTYETPQQLDVVAQKLQEELG